MTFSYIPSAPEGAPDPETRDRAREKAVSVIPKSERYRAGYGSLEMSLQSVGDLCSQRKCVRKSDHDGPHWPV
jgi:hypothetical protein